MFYLPMDLYLCPSTPEYFTAPYTAQLGELGHLQLRNAVVSSLFFPACWLDSESAAADLWGHPSVHSALYSY